MTAPAPRAFIFPGQGSQAVGMGKALALAEPAARAVFDEVDVALGENLSHLMFEGPEEKLRLTENAQPALMAVSLAVVSVLREKGFKLPEQGLMVAGHSLGEYSALAAAGALSVTDAARVLKARGQAMQAAVPVGQGAMAALLGLDFEAAEALARQAAADTGLVCAPANDNAPGQVVVSGHKQAVERAIALAAEKGAKRSVLLPVSAPFHCSLMAPAAEKMRAVLSSITFKNPIIPLVANVTAQKVSDAMIIRDLLVTQVTGVVRWRESVLYMKKEGISQLVEIGAGKVLSGLARRIDRDLATQSLETPDDIKAFLESQ